MRKYTFKIKDSMGSFPRGMLCLIALYFGFSSPQTTEASTWMKEALKPKNVKPPDPEAKNPRMPSERPSMEPKPVCIRGPESNCTSQGSAYDEAASAASYLGFYFFQNSFFGAEHDLKGDKKNEIHKLIAKCIVGRDSCDDTDKRQLATAKIQYNIGKYIRNMILQSNTLRENLRSPVALDPNVKDELKLLTKEGRFPGDVKSKTIADKTLGSTFKLDIEKVPPPTHVEYEFYRDVQVEVVDEDTHEKKSVEVRKIIKREKVTKREADILGTAFIQEYGIFLDTISNSGVDEKNHELAWRKGFINVHSYQTEYKDVQKFNYSQSALRNAAPEIKYSVDQDKYNHIHSQHNGDAVKEGTESIKKEWVNLDANKKSRNLHGNDFNIAKYDPEKGHTPFEWAKAAAKKVNDRITEIEKQDTIRAGKEVKYVQLKVEDFDKFLDSIWPPSEEHRKTLMAQHQNPNPGPEQVSRKNPEPEADKSNREPSALKEEAPNE